MTAQMKLPPWSFSMIEKFENCPRQTFHKYILKEKEPETEDMRQGNLLDKAIEARIKKDTPMPADFAQYEAMAASVAKLKSPDSTVYTQLKLGIDKEFKPCEFFGSKGRDPWGRGALDVAIISKRTANKPNTAVILDWKTGKNSEGKSYSNQGLQLKIFTLLLFKAFPGVENVTAFNVWLKTNEIGNIYKWSRTDESNLWREILPRIMKMEAAFKAYSWPETPGPLCKYCPVKTCQFNRS